MSDYNINTSIFFRPPPERRCLTVANNSGLFKSSITLLSVFGLIYNNYFICFDRQGNCFKMHFYDKMSSTIVKKTLYDNPDGGTFWILRYAWEANAAMGNWGNFGFWMSEFRRYRFYFLKK